MADTQTAPQAPAGLQPIPALGGSITEAQEALLGLMEPEEEKPQEEEAQPTEEEESQPVEEDESFEEESEEEEAEEAEEESEETEGEEEEELYAVTVNGEEVAVSLDELLSGYSRQSDYTRKTQEIANDRKEMETLQQQYNSQMSTIQQERQHYMESLQGIITNSASGLSKYSDIDLHIVVKFSDLDEDKSIVKSFFDFGFIGKLTPFGGIAFTIAWLLLAVESKNNF